MVAPRALQVRRERLGGRLSDARSGCLRRLRRRGRQQALASGLESLDLECGDESVVERLGVVSFGVAHGFGLGVFVVGEGSSRRCCLARCARTLTTLLDRPRIAAISRGGSSSQASILMISWSSGASVASAAIVRLSWIGRAVAWWAARASSCVACAARSSCCFERWLTLRATPKSQGRLLRRRGFGRVFPGDSEGFGETVGGVLDRQASPHEESQQVLARVLK